jgi:Zn-dependent protease with chaperone function
MKQYLYLRVLDCIVNDAGEDPHKGQTSVEMPRGYRFVPGDHRSEDFMGTATGEVPLDYQGSKISIMIRAACLALALPLIAVPLHAQFSLNKLKKAVDKAADVVEIVDDFTFSEAEEIELGMAISNRIRARYGVAQDPEATRFMSLVGTLVAQKSGRPSIPWKWIILDSEVINAFAAPGGYVHVTRGALAVIRSEAELAGVLAHEAAHINRKHTLKALQKSMGIELAQNQASFAVGSALFEAAADQAAKAVMAGFGQAEELDADKVGMEIAFRVGYQAAGLTKFLDTLNSVPTGASSSSALFRSHPETDERIKKLNKAIKKNHLDDGVWLAERYAAAVTYDAARASTGGPADAGSRGVAGTTEIQPAEQDESTAEEDDDGGKFTLAKLADPFAMGDEEESAEVTGAGAGRAVGEEEGEDEGGIKNTRIVEVQISPEELDAFRKEGGLK